MFGEVRLGDIVQNIESQDWRLFLCKPDYTVIAPIKDVTDLSWNIRAGKVDEMSFTIPAQVDVDHTMVDNPLIKKIKHRYLFKLIYNNRETYLIFSEDDKSYSNDESVSFKAYGLGYMLRDKTIRDWSATSKNIQYMLDEVLQETNWKVGFVDADINSKYRSHEVSNNNVLEIVYELAEKFGGLIVWDTVNKVINIYKPENVGKDKGFRLREGKYLESFNQNTNSDDVVTRLKVYGKDGLTFRRLSPTGSNYIEDFSWFLYPFEQDEQGRVIKHSNYMSDGLASGIVEYQNHLAGIQGSFESLTTQLTSKQDEIKQREQELSVLLTDLKVIMDELDVYNSTKSGNVSDITSRRNAKQAQIDSKTSQITTLQNQEKSIQSQLDSLRTNVQMSNFLTPEQMLELNDYIITKDYTNDSIVDEEDLLADGIEAFKTFRQPKVNLNIDIVNFLKNLESQNDWDKLGLGDTIYIKNSRLDVDISAKITEIQFNLTGEDINLTLANEHEILDSDELFLKKIYDAANTSTSVNMNQWKWDLVEETNSLVHRLLTEGLNAAERAITAGYKQNISISERGIIIKSDQEPHKWIVMQNGVIGLTNNNGNSWEVAVTPDGVYAQTLIGKIIMGSRLIIEDEDGIIRLSGSKQEIFDAAGNQKVVLGEYETDKYGLRIYNGAIEIINGLPENQIDPKATEKWNSAEANAKKFASDEISKVTTQVGELQGTLNGLDEYVDGAFKDGIITEVEKSRLNALLDSLMTERADVVERYTHIYAHTLLPSNEKTVLQSAKTDFDNKYNALVKSVNDAIADDKITEAEKTTVNSNLTAYSTSIGNFSRAIEVAITAIANKMSVDAEERAKQFTRDELVGVNNDIGEVSKAVGDLDGYVDGAFKDGLIQESEAIAIEKYINTLSTEKADLDDRYTAIYGNSNLTGTAKTNLASAKTAFNTAHSNLVTSINNAIADGKTTSAESTDVDAKFSSYQTALAALAKRLEEAVNAIALKMSSDAESNANSYTDGKIQTVNQQIGELNDAVGTLEDDLNTMLEDGVLGAEERARLNALLDTLTLEKADVDEQFNAVYADANIPPANQTALQTTKTALNTSHDSLIATINTALTDNIISDEEKTSVNNAFNDYKTKLTTFSQTINIAILAIAQNVGEKVDTKLRKYADDSSGAVRNDLRLVAPLPTNITMDASGITASTASSSSFAALDYRGLYVQGGAFDLRTGSASNRGVKIDGSGIHAYNSSGVRTFYVDTNGNLNASRGTFSGSITGATGTFYGSLSAVGGTFTGTLNGADGTFSGTVSAGRISGGTVDGATISSGDSSANGITTVSYGTVKNYKTFSNSYSQTLEISSGNMIIDYISQYSGKDYRGRYGYNSVNFTSSSDNANTTFHHNGITAYKTNYFTIDAAVQFKGSVNFSGATISGLNLTAKFG